MSQADLISAIGTDRVLFELDQHSLGQEAQQILERQASWLRQHPEVALTIAGHCDERGTRDYNLALGERRAISVSQFLVSRGVEASRLRTISYGKERPDAVGSDDESHARNRRAVSLIVQPG